LSSQEGKPKEEAADPALLLHLRKKKQSSVGLTFFINTQEGLKLHGEERKPGKKS